MVVALVSTTSSLLPEFCLENMAELSITIKLSALGRPIIDIFCLGLGGRGGADSMVTVSVSSLVTCCCRFSLITFASS